MTIEQQTSRADLRPVIVTHHAARLVRSRWSGRTYWKIAPELLADYGDGAEEFGGVAVGALTDLIAADLDVWEPPTWTLRPGWVLDWLYQHPTGRVLLVRTATAHTTAILVRSSLR